MSIGDPEKACPFPKSVNAYNVVTFYLYEYLFLERNIITNSKCKLKYQNVCICIYTYIYIIESDECPHMLATIHTAIARTTEQGPSY